MIEILIVGWLACGVTSYGIYVHHFQTKFPTIAYDHRVRDRVGAVILGLLGPVGLLGTIWAKLELSGKWGWRL